MEQVTMTQKMREQELDDWWNNCQLAEKEIIAEVYEQFVEQWAERQEVLRRYCLEKGEQDEEM